MKLMKSDLKRNIVTLNHCYDQLNLLCGKYLSGESEERIAKLIEYLGRKRYLN